MSRLLRQQGICALTCPITASPRFYSTPFRPAPGPPKLAAEEQAEFERLQREAAVSSAFQPTSDSSSATTSMSSSTTSTPSTSANQTSADQTSAAEEEDEDVSTGLFRGAKPEFKGDTNPKTGEVGGPKNEPLRWGGQGDWSYNGRVTDF